MTATKYYYLLHNRSEKNQKLKNQKIYLVMKKVKY